MQRSFGFWFTALVLLYSIYDYLEHILRPGSIFEAQPLDWFIFSAGAILLMLVTVLGINMLLERLFGRKAIAFELISIAIWLILHLTLYGPLLDKTVWPHSELSFRFSFSAFFIILINFFVIRMGIYGVLRWRKSRTTSSAAPQSS